MPWDGSASPLCCNISQWHETGHDVGEQISALKTLNIIQSENPNSLVRWRMNMHVFPPLPHPLVKQEILKCCTIWKYGEPGLRWYEGKDLWRSRSMNIYVYIEDFKWLSWTKHIEGTQGIIAQNRQFARDCIFSSIFLVLRHQTWGF